MKFRLKTSKHSINKEFKLLLLFTFIVFFSKNLLAQQEKKTILTIKGDSVLHKYFKKIEKPIILNQPGQIQKTIDNLIFNLNKLGYLAARVDSVTKLSNQYTCYISSNKYYRLKKVITKDSLIFPFYNEIQQSKQHTNWPSWWIERSQKWLEDRERNGYPFAQIQLKPLVLIDTASICEIILKSNDYIIFDTFDIIGDAEVHKKYLEQYLSIKPGTAYNEQLVLEIDKKLNEILWISLEKPTEIYFIGNKASIKIYINKKQSGNFDAILGLSPGSDLTKEQILVTGEAHLKLLNLFKRGYGFELDYISYRASSKELKAKTTIPYLFGTSLGTEANFNLVKFDSLYLDLIADVGLLYQRQANQYIKLYFKKQSVTLLQYDTQQVSSTMQLPEFNDITNNRYGIYIKQYQLDNSRNPRRGWSIDLDVSAGTKKIGQVEGIKQLGLYKNISLQSLQFQSNLGLRLFVPLSKNLVWHLQTKAAQVYAPQIFYNDLYRIGGLKSIRGFDEQSIFASAYFIGNTEIRYLFSTYSNALVFINGGWWENNSINIYKNGYPVGIGMGSNIETKAGIFSIYYALGKDFYSRFILKNGKVHFGYVNYF